MSELSHEEGSGVAVSEDLPDLEGPPSPEEDETFGPEPDDPETGMAYGQAYEVEFFDETHEQRDLHDADDPDDPEESLRRGRVIKELRGAGKVFDYRGSGILPPNGGRIRPLIMVEHIPVVPNVPGTQDFRTLARVLRGQGLSLQAATDSEGNVALYNNLDRLCYQARGANQVSCGVEHMHWSTSEPWTKKQLRAAAWLWVHAEREYGIPLRIARLGAGKGHVVVVKRGHTSHQRVSQAAGFNDRSDPGPGFDYRYVRRAALFFKKHGHFEGV